MRVYIHTNLPADVLRSACMYVLYRAASTYLPLEFTIDGVAKTVNTTQWDAFVCVAVGETCNTIHTTYIHTVHTYC